MPTCWKTNIPKPIYAKLYCSWRRVKHEVDLLANIFRKHRVYKLIEFGCGLGRHGYLLSKHGFQVLLTDVIDWRYGVARKTPFTKLDVLENNSSVDNGHEAGYGINFLTIFKYDDMVRVLENVGEIVNRGILLFDYNFTLYREPGTKVVKYRGRTYYALLEHERVEEIEGGVLYRYRVRVCGKNRKTIGLEEGSYIVYDKSTVFRAVGEAGYEVIDIVWVTWDPAQYMYRLVLGESDSAFLVLRKKSRVY